MACVLSLLHCMSLSCTVVLLKSVSKALSGSVFYLMIAQGVLSFHFVILLYTCTCRDVKEQLLELSLKRVGEWRKTEPSTVQSSSVPVNQSSSEPKSKHFSEPVQASSPVPVAFQRASTGPTTSPLPTQHDSDQYRPSASTYLMPSDIQYAPQTAHQSVLSQALPSALQSPSVGYPASVYQSELQQQSIMAPLRLESSHVPLSSLYGYTTRKETSSSGMNPYKQTLEMLECLGFQELLPTFKQHMLRVSSLLCIIMYLHVCMCTVQ